MIMLFAQYRIRYDAFRNSLVEIVRKDRGEI